MEQCFQANKEIEDLQKLQLHKQHHKIPDRYQNVSARVVTSFRERKKSENNHVSSTSKNNIQSNTNNPALTDKDAEEKVQIQNSNSLLELDKKHVPLAKRIVRQGINNNISDRQKKTRNKSQQKPQPKVSSEPDILHESENDMNAQITIKYRNRGVQTLDTDQVESIYSEGIIR